MSPIEVFIQILLAEKLLGACRTLKTFQLL